MAKQSAQYQKDTVHLVVAVAVFVCLMFGFVAGMILSNQNQSIQSDAATRSR